MSINPPDEAPEHWRRALLMTMKDFGGLGADETIQAEDVKLDKRPGGIALPDGTFIREADMMAAIRMLGSGAPAAPSVGRWRTNGVGGCEIKPE